MQREPQMKFLSPPLHWPRGQNLQTRCLKTWAKKINYVQAQRSQQVSMKSYLFNLGVRTLMRRTPPCWSNCTHRLQDGLCCREKVHAFHVFVCEEHISLGLSSAVVCLIHKSTLLHLYGMFIKLIKSCSRRVVRWNAQSLAVIGTLSHRTLPPGSSCFSFN